MRGLTGPWRLGSRLVHVMVRVTDRG